MLALIPTKRFSIVRSVKSIMSFQRRGKMALASIANPTIFLNNGIGNLNKKQAGKFPSAFLYFIRLEKRKS